MRKSKNNKNNTTTIIPSTSDKTPIEIAYDTQINDFSNYKCKF